MNDPVGEKTLVLAQKDSQHADEILTLRMEALAERVTRLEDGRKWLLGVAGTVLTAILCDVAVRFV